MVALACAREGETLVTTRRIVELAGSRPAVQLSEPLAVPIVRAAVHVTPEAAFVGLNRGEWGGGLRRIDRRTGKAEKVEQREDSGCVGLLNSDCDPVNDIVSIPWRRECVAAAVGLVHFFPAGRLVSVCPGGIEKLLALAARPHMPEAERRAKADEGRFGSVAFFGLVATGDALLAAGVDGLYRLRPDGSYVQEKWPRFTRIDDTLVSFERPDLVLVLSELNRRASVSGSAPLLVPR